MIRCRLHRRLVARYPHWLAAAVCGGGWELRHWTWIDRYSEWSVRRYGEAAGGNPWWDRVLGRLVSGWLGDWRSTLGVYFGLRDRRARLMTREGWITFGHELGFEGPEADDVGGHT